jgi:hypothetical protein
MGKPFKHGGLINPNLRTTMPYICMVNKKPKHEKAKQ